jgi:hypothetical protein
VSFLQPSRHGAKPPGTARQASRSLSRRSVPSQSARAPRGLLPAGHRDLLRPPAPQTRAANFVHVRSANSDPPASCSTPANAPAPDRTHRPRPSARRILS